MGWHWGTSTSPLVYHWSAFPKAPTKLRAGWLTLASYKKCHKKLRRLPGTKRVKSADNQGLETINVNVPFPYLSQPAQQGVLVILLDYVLPRQLLKILARHFQGLGKDVGVCSSLSGVRDVEPVEDWLHDRVIGIIGPVLKRECERRFRALCLFIEQLMRRGQMLVHDWHHLFRILSTVFNGHQTSATEEQCYGSLVLLPIFQWRM